MVVKLTVNIKDASYALLKTNILKAHPNVGPNMKPSERTDDEHIIYVIERKILRMFQAGDEKIRRELKADLDLDIFDRA